MGRLPDFLIIGAMKAGTTSLYRDLLTNPAVFFPADKEPGNLTDDRVLTEAGRREYELLFRAAVEGQICGEASTTYTKEPDLSGAATRAREALGRDAKIVYLVRPLLPLDTRNSLRNLVAPKPPPRPAPPSVATIEYLLEQLRDDTRRLASLMGRSEPPWRPEDALKHAR